MDPSLCVIHPHTCRWSLLPASYKQNVAKAVTHSCIVHLALWTCTLSIFINVLLRTTFTFSIIWFRDLLITLSHILICITFYLFLNKLSLTEKVVLTSFIVLLDLLVPHWLNTFSSVKCKIMLLVYKDLQLLYCPDKGRLLSISEKCH